ncbi:MAG: hypothetical protein AAB551_01265 [Patescibacteria group bacterium]
MPFITFYGINNIGKTTHVKLLVERLRHEGYDAISLKYPVYDIAPTGPFLNQTLRHHDGAQALCEEELQLWFTLNRFQFQPTLEQYLKEGKIVIAEDYVGTGIAWGATKGASESWLTELNMPLRKADFSILMTGERILKSKEDSHIHENDDHLVLRVGETLKRLAAEQHWYVLPVHEKREETAEDIYNVVKNFLATFPSANS